MSLEFLSVPPANGQSPTGLIVLLHGWGANLYDLAPLCQELNLPDCQFICVDAPFPHPRVPGGKMWYDLESRDYRGLPESRQMLLDLLECLESSTGVPLSRTIVSGFSQGGAMTLDVGLRLPVAGLVSMSGYLHGEPGPAGEKSPLTLPPTLPPTLIMHGRQDQVVDLSAARQARHIFAELGVPVQYREFDMVHEIRPSEIQLMRDFVRELFSAQNPGMIT